MGRRKWRWTWAAPLVLGLVGCTTGSADAQIDRHTTCRQFLAMSGPRQREALRYLVEHGTLETTATSVPPLLEDAVREGCAHDQDQTFGGIIDWMLGKPSPDPRFSPQARACRNEQARVEVAVKAYRLQTGRDPRSLRELTTETDEGRSQLDETPTYWRIDPRHPGKVVPRRTLPRGCR